MLYMIQYYRNHRIVSKCGDLIETKRTKIQVLGKTSVTNAE